MRHFTKFVAVLVAAGLISSAVAPTASAMNQPLSAMCGSGYTRMGKTLPIKTKGGTLLATVYAFGKNNGSKKCFINLASSKTANQKIYRSIYLYRSEGDPKVARYLFDSDKGQFYSYAGPVKSTDVDNVLIKASVTYKGKTYTVRSTYKQNWDGF